MNLPKDTSLPIAPVLSNVGLGFNLYLNVCFASIDALLVASSIRIRLNCISSWIVFKAALPPNFGLGRSDQIEINYLPIIADVVDDDGILGPWWMHSGNSIKIKGGQLFDVYVALMSGKWPTRSFIEVNGERCTENLSLDRYFNTITDRWLVLMIII